MSDIKKAFRKLAMTYHPDKQKESAQYSSYFSEIQEAYTVLSDPAKKEQYLYQRWLEKSMGHALDKALDAEALLKLFIKAEKYISQSDTFRIKKNILLQQLLDLFSELRLNTILQKNDSQITNEIIKLAIKISSYLDSQGAGTLMAQFDHFLEYNPNKRIDWQHVIERLKKQENISRLTIPLAILITLILCIILFLMTRM